MLKTQSLKSGLKPNAWYVSSLVYECNVDKLKLEIVSETVDFNTLKPIAVTGGTSNVTSNLASVECSFDNADGSWCDVEYYSSTNEDGTPNTKSVSAGTDGEQSVTLSGLLPDTTYTCSVVVKAGGKEFHGDSYTFTTSPEPLHDLSRAWIFEQEFFSG